MSVSGGCKFNPCVFTDTKAGMSLPSQSKALVVYVFLHCGVHAFVSHMPFKEKATVPSLDVIIPWPKEKLLPIKHNQISTKRTHFFHVVKIVNTYRRRAHLFILATQLA